MRKLILGVIIGLVFGLILTFSSATVANTLTAKWFDVSIIVDGQKTNIKDKPIIVNGRTYVPLREFSNLTNVGIKYNGSSKTIILTTNENKVSQPVEPKPSKNTNTNNKENKLTISDLEKHGFKIDTSGNLVIQKGNEKYRFSESMQKKLVETGSSFNVENYTSFYVYYINGEYYFSESIIKAFSIY